MALLEGLGLHSSALVGAFLRNDYTAHKIKEDWPGPHGVHGRLALINHLQSAAATLRPELLGPREAAQPAFEALRSQLWSETTISLQC